VLVPNEALTFELIGRAGSTERVELGSGDALALVAEAAGRGAKVGLDWRVDELLLQPSDHMVALIRKSQDVAAANQGEGG
jgi:TfoX/Sxy family transcriptional regulator of competence genes